MPKANAEVDPAHRVSAHLTIAAIAGRGSRVAVRTTHVGVIDLFHIAAGQVQAYQQVPDPDAALPLDRLLIDARI